MALLARIGTLAVVIVNVDGSFIALDDLCLRCGSSLAAGHTCGHDRVCAGCGWRYDLDSGCVAGVPALRINQHAVRVEGDRIFVASNPLPYQAGVSATQPRTAPLRASVRRRC